MDGSGGTHPLDAAPPHAKVGLLQVADLDAAVAALVVAVGLQAVVEVDVALALAAAHEEVSHDKSW